MSLLSSRRALAPAALAALAALIVGATSATVASAASQPPDARFRAGLSLPFLASPFFVTLSTLTTQAAKSAGLDWLQPTDAGSDPGKQISDIQTLVNSGAKGLIVVPRDSDAIAPALKYAAAHHVAVVAVDVGLHIGQGVITVRADNLSMAKSACEAIGTALEGRGKVLELQGDLLNVNGLERTQGFERCMRKSFPKIELFARPTRWEQARAADATQTMLTVHPEIAAIYMESGSVMLPGVLSVLKQAGRAEKVGVSHHVFLMTIDGSPYELSRIRAGELDAAVSQPVNLYARIGIEYLRRAVAGEIFAEGPTEHGSRIVRSASGDLEDLLPAPIVTRANVDDPSLWGNIAH